jgi:hypothetical protein
MREGTLGDSVQSTARSDRPLKPELLGVSHLVLSVSEPSTSEPALEALGYGEHEANENCPNPREKAPFLSGPLLDTCAMRLMLPANGSTAIEVLRGAKASPALPHFEGVLSEESAASPADVRTALAKRHEVVIPGLSRPPGADGKRGVGALLIHVDALETALPLWRTLGYAEEDFDSHVRKVAIRGLRASNRLDLYFVEDREKIEMGHLDVAGVVCLSLFCRDADRLRATLSDRGYEVGGCFTLTPFGTALRIFFMRNATGEIYEFLSIANSRGSEEGS